MHSILSRRPARLLSVLVLLLFAGLRSGAQLPTCSGASAGLIYSTSGNAITQYNPALPNSGTNPFNNTISVPGGAYGLVISANLNAAAPSPTFYVVQSGLMYYYNGTAWVSTGHSSGYTGGLPNCAAGGGYIFIHDWITGQVFRYDGTGPATFLTTIAGYGTSGGVHGLAADCLGNWYAFVSGTGGGIRKYSSAGVLLQSYTNAGSAPFGGEGMTLLGNDFYVNAGNHYKGVVTGSTVTWTAGAVVTSAGIHSYTACAGGFGSPVVASIDTGYYCGTGPGLPVSVSGSAPFTWSLIGGAATLSGTTGSSIVITPTGTATVRVRVEGSPGVCGPSGADTVTIIIPTATVDAGPASTALGCGVYRDTLGATVTNQTPGVTYNIAWLPAGSVVSGGNTLTPIVAPTGNTPYTLTLFTPPAQGSCTFTDTVSVQVQDISVDAGFNYAIRYGCAGDTVDFINSSTALAGTMTYRWDFGDGTTDTAKNPTHIYTTPGTYAAKLVVTNGPCADSLVASLPLDHPLVAGFMPSVDSFCQGDTVFFTNTTIATTRNGIAPRYFWSFGDGGTDTVENPRHYYAAGGIYVVTLAVRDFVPCTNTIRDTIVVDSLPYARILLSDTALCQGEATSFAAQFLAMGNTGLSWSFGDGTGDSGDSLRVTHGYDEPGLYDVILAATYRKCRDTADTVRVVVQPFPSLNIGADTSICPGGEPILLTARLSGGGGFPGVTQVVWSTRDTASSIVVRHHGDYWARATGAGGCSATDSVHVAKDCYLDLPNVFSPNGDGTNDYFWPRQLLSEGLVRFSMTIYNRWGQKIWETTRIEGRGWDGKFNGEDQPTGVFIYLVEAEFSNGVREKYQGNVTLLR